MSFISNLFGGSASQAPAANPQAPTPGNLPVAASPMTPNGNGVVPGNTNMNPKAEEPKTPMAEHKDLWNTDPNAKTEVPEPLFNVDPVKLRAATKQNDFSKAIPPDLIDKIKAGGDDAAEAMVLAMNAVAQESQAQNIQATAKIVESALEKQQAAFLDRLPGIIKNSSTLEQARSTNPLLQNPATSPVMEAVLKQVQQKFPTASAAEHQKMADKYVMDFADLAQAPGKQAAANAASTKAGETDFSSWDTN